jgi:hypothetical protein
MCWNSDMRPGVAGNPLWSLVYLREVAGSRRWFYVTMAALAKTAKTMGHRELAPHA